MTYTSNVSLVDNRCQHMLSSCLLPAIRKRSLCISLAEVRHDLEHYGTDVPAEQALDLNN